MTPTVRWILRPWIEGKRVCVAAGADTLNDNPPGLIDSYDVVIKVNDVWRHPSDNRGHRADIVFCHTRQGGAIKMAAEQSKPLPFRVAIHQIEDPECRPMFWMLHYGVIQTNDLMHCSEAVRRWLCLRLSPFTGVNAVVTALDLRPAELYVTGMTFFRTPHFYAEKPKGTLKGHDPVEQVAAFRDRIYPHPAVTVDSAIQAIMDESPSISKSDPRSFSG